MPDVVAYFTALAADYCELIESAESVPPDVLLARLHMLLPALIASVQELPDTAPTTDESPSGVRDTEWSARFAALNAALGEHAGYWTTSEALAADEPEVSYLPLADDLADIWRDIKRTLQALHSGGAIADAIWQWRFDFETHWGTHAVEALRAVHGSVRRPSA